jgi:hypothetical protein
MAGSELQKSQQATMQAQMAAKQPDPMQAQLEQAKLQLEAQRVELERQKVSIQAQQQAEKHALEVAKLQAEQMTARGAGQPLRTER